MFGARPFEAESGGDGGGFEVRVEVGFGYNKRNCIAEAFPGCGVFSGNGNSDAICAIGGRIRGVVKVIGVNLHR